MLAWCGGEACRRIQSAEPKRAWRWNVTGLGLSSRQNCNQILCFAGMVWQVQSLKPHLILSRYKCCSAEASWLCVKDLIFTKRFNKLLQVRVQKEHRAKFSLPTIVNVAQTLLPFTFNRGQGYDQTDTKQHCTLRLDKSQGTVQLRIFEDGEPCIKPLPYFWGKGFGLRRVWQACWCQVQAECLVWWNHHALYPSPPPFLPSVCVDNNTQEQKTSENGEGLEAFITWMMSCGHKRGRRGERAQLLKPCTRFIRVLYHSFGLQTLAWLKPLILITGC